MLAVVQRVSGSVLWANLHLLFWLSLVPFVTDWLSEEDVVGILLTFVNQWSASRSTCSWP